MTAPRVRADYDVLRTMSASWRQQAGETARSFQQLRSQMQTLQGGDWVGKGATAFYTEMNDQVLPTMQRLADALTAAGDTTQKISGLMKLAEDEAASFFKVDGGAAAAGGAAGAAAGFAGGVAAAAAGAAVGAAAKAVADAAKAAAVQKFLDKGDKAGAMAEAIKQYGVDISSAKAGTPVHDASVPGEGATSKDGAINIGDKAFKSPGLLATVIGHEHVHAQQAADRWYRGTQGTELNEVEAYDWELKNAGRFNLTKAEIADIQQRRDKHYNKLNADNKKIVDGGSFVLPAGKTNT